MIPSRMQCDDVTFSSHCCLQTIKRSMITYGQGTAMSSWQLVYPLPLHTLQLSINPKDVCRGGKGMGVEEQDAFLLHSELLAP